MMKHSLRRAATLAALMASAFALGAHASDPHSPRANPADASAVVPPTRYTSTDLAATATVATPSPAQNWRALNDLVASYDAMALTTDMAAARPAEPAAPAPAPPTPATRPVVTDPHAGHRPKAVK